jgi:hypothetical protein
MSFAGNSTAGSSHHQSAASPSRRQYGKTRPSPTLAA